VTQSDPTFYRHY